MIAKQVVMEGEDAERVARAIVDGLRAPDLAFAFVFADWRLDPNILGKLPFRELGVPVVGGTAVGVIGPKPTRGMTAVALGFYGNALKFGVGIATDVLKSPIPKTRDAVHQAARALGTTVDRLDPARHVGVMIVDGKCGAEEACCIGSAAAAPQIRFVGGCVDSVHRPLVWAGGEAISDAAVVVVIESSLPFVVVQSTHVVPTDIKTVVTAASGRSISELDGFPAASRLASLVAHLGPLGAPRTHYSFARYVDGIPYVRSIAHIDGECLQLASAVEPGQVLRIMRPGDLIGQTVRDLAEAEAKVNGMSAFLAFSCIGRHWEAAARGIESELGVAYARYPTIGFQSFGEQSGMLLCNHTLAGLAIGSAP
jgi:hypothetical protein